MSEGLTSLKTEGGFWVPNELVDKARRTSQTSGTYWLLRPEDYCVFCVLCRALTLRHYPSAEDLASLTGLSVDQAHQSLSRLYDLDLLNDHDLVALGLAEKET